MSRYLRGQLRHRAGRALTVGLGILVACVSFSLLTASATTSTLRVRGTVAENFRTSYDLLVRPPNTQSDLERREGLVRNNLESGIFGGITRAQWRAIRALRGVEVAAPVQYLGYIIPFARVELSLKRFVSGKRTQLYRLRQTSVSQRGLSRLPGPSSFVYLTQRNGGCSGLGIFGPPPTSPFSGTGPRESFLSCFAPASARQRLVPEDVSVEVNPLVPLLIAAVDPVEENRLLRLERATVSGSPLTPQLGFTKTHLGPIVPVLASNRSYLDEALEVTVEQVMVPAGRHPGRRLREPSLGTDDFPESPNAAYRWARSLHTVPVDKIEVTIADIYQQILTQMRNAGPTTTDSAIFTGYWSVTNPEFAVLPNKTLAPATVRNDPSKVWIDPAGLGGPGGALTPQDNRDVQFRTVSPHPIVLNKLRTGQAELDLRGEFDPRLLPGFDRLNRVPLETYFPPLAEPANAVSRKALNGQTLAPSANIGEYLAQPPALLTTLRAARGLTEPRFFQRTNHQAPISVIRVRVEGVTGPDDASLERIRRTAQLIVDRTGLVVDVTAGSSPSPQRIALPAGEFGRPSLLVEEGWAKKGVALVILAAVDRKSVMLFGLVLLVTSGFLGNAALASVRARRAEIGTLLCLGWAPRHIFGAVLGEIALIGLVSGIVGCGIAGLLIAAFSLQVPLARVALVPPLAVALAVLAGAIPATLAARGLPVEVVNPVISGRSTDRSTRHLPALAWVGLRRRPGRALVATVSLFVGVGALGLLLAINLAFQGSLAGSVLGEFVAVQARTVDYVSVTLAITLAGFSVADVLVLNTRERAPELAALQATGWADRHVAQLILYEGAIMATIGCIAGAGLGLLLGVFLGGPFRPLLVAAALAAGAGLCIAMIAAAIPARLAAGTPIAHVIATE